MEALEGVRPYMESHGGNVDAAQPRGRRRQAEARRAAATAARPRPRPWSWRSSRRWTRRRPTSRGSRSRESPRAPGGSARRGGALGDAAAGGARRRRGQRQRRRERAPPHPTPPPIGSSRWLDLAAGLMPADGQDRHDRAGDMSVLIANVERVAARLPRPLRRPASPSSPPASSRAGCSPAPNASAASTCRARAARWTRTSFCSSPSRCSPRTARSGSPFRHDRRERLQREQGRPAPGRAGLISSLRRLSRPGAAAERRGAPRRSASCAATSLPENHNHLLHLTERRILCACATLLGAALGRPRAASDRQPHRLARRASSCPTSFGRSCRSRSASPSSCFRASPRRWSRCTRAQRARPSPSST